MSIAIKPKTSTRQQEHEAVVLFRRLPLTREVPGSRATLIKIRLPVDYPTRIGVPGVFFHSGKLPVAEMARSFRVNDVARTRLPRS